MNPLQAFWIKVQPLSGCLTNQSWKAISQSSSIASSSGDDTVVQRTTTSSEWAFNHFKNAASRLASNVYYDLYYASSSWLLTPMISRMQDAAAPILKPSSSYYSNRALCEADQRFTPRKLGSGVDAAAATPLQQSQQILQQQDYINYQIQPPRPLVRKNSKEWVREYKKERIDKINFNKVFGGISHDASNEIPTLPPPPADENSYARGGLSLETDDSKSLIHPDSPASSSTATTTAESVTSLSSLSHTISNKTTTSGAPAATDVICGRGGKANTHPGNIFFREEARKLRSWYESSSKSEKFTISSLLVDFVRERGGRFLKRDGDVPGQWAEADGNDVRKKASQALREGRVKEKRQ
mmetsp:Transcript_22/g.30  ORF Transcript_22/g.30 Transcript_22/m.30 type:complete len:355 (-) Transcript_22:232-1296(-)|eukprot:CAMPEP_0172298892 /NCGR_PEP_ID=MMETSP1058-20130122/1335_1 /TAXON_ID=83371 /ORGANISM="Detonula confervacea, Strain CCMP 353" /LENGTH=354 /DNA_ID=CAMNT_0013008187 /DNA_START=179 /DNA_END=1243 /DNA_ORIENTATION=+